ncbi:hypothetical protein [Okeania sp. SIO2B3]|nr:hypothetical protein [Okeania sp. SIO2B3]NET46828.1 hypothetical protein [Okeania sp. SIO2B3]
MQDSKPHRFFRASQNAFFGSSQLSGAIADNYIQRYQQKLWLFLVE